MRHDELAGIGPAPYALPRGTPALQDPPHLRRLLASLALSGVLVAGTAGFLVGRSKLPEPAYAVRGQARAEDLARGPLSELLREHHLFLAADGMPEPTFWYGVRRLLRSALTDEEHPAPELLSRLQRTIRESRQGEPPEDVQRLAPLLEHRLRLAQR